MRSEVSVLILDSSGLGLGRMVLVSEGLVSVSDGQVLVFISVSDFEAETPSLVFCPNSIYYTCTIYGNLPEICNLPEVTSHLISKLDRI